MRAIWKGQISFGLINIPIELFSAEKSPDIKFKLFDSKNKAKVRYERINEKTGKEVPWHDVVKAYEINKNEYVIVDEEDFKRATIVNTQTFEIEDFIALDNLDVILFEKPYYLAPLKNAQKGYVLLREILKKLNKVAIGKVVIRTKQYLAALFPHKDVLVLNLMRFPQQLKSYADLNIPTGTLKQYKISDKEIEMAEKLVNSMTTPWQPKKYKDEYSHELLTFIAKKAKSGKMPIRKKLPEEEFESGAQIVDFMSLLKKSLKKSPQQTKKQPKKTQRTVVTHNAAKKVRRK